MFSELFTLSFIISSTVIYCNEAATVDLGMNTEMYTDCSGWKQCILSLDQLEQLIFEYLSDIHDKEKYDMICPIINHTDFNCHHDQDDCHLKELKDEADFLFSEYSYVCDQFEVEWKKNETFLMEDDLGCKKIVQCLKNVSDENNIYNGVFGALKAEDIRFSQYCAYSERFYSCWANTTTRCKFGSMHNLLMRSYRFYVQYCLEKKYIVSNQTLESISTGRCQRDRCWNDLLQVNYTDLENAFFSSDKLKRQEVCLKRQQFAECDNRYEHVCPITRANDRLKFTDRLLNQSFCSLEEKTAAEINEYKLFSYCDGMEECFEPLAERERNAVIYMAEIYNKSNYNNLCNFTEPNFYSCYQKKSKTCYLTFFDNWISYSHQLLIEYCNIVDRGWGINAPVSFLNEDDKASCSEPFVCLKKLVEEEDIAAGYVDMYLNQTKYDNLCLNSEKVRTCISMSKMYPCRSYYQSLWLHHWKKLIAANCEHIEQNDGFTILPYLDFSKVWNVINSSKCIQDTCWIMMDKINRTVMENFELTASENQLMKKEYCNIKEKFKNCMNGYQICRSPVTADRFTKSHLLEYIYCSNNDTTDLSCCSFRHCYSDLSYIKNIMAGNYSYLLNEENYDKMCPLKNDTYECLSQNLGVGQDKFDGYSFLTIKKIHEFVCSDNGRKAIAQVNRSRCSINDTEFQKANEEYHSCPLMKRPNYAFLDCPERIGEMMENCLRVAFEERCGSEFTAFHRKLWQIKNRNKRCEQIPQDPRYWTFYRF